MKTLNNLSPRIIKESSRGFDSLSVEDNMLLNRQILCTGEINDDVSTSIAMQLLYLERQDADKEITIYVSSPGGSVDSGLAICDAMRSISCPVRTICIGLSASIAAIIFACGDKRSMYENSRIMIHDPYIQNATTTASRIAMISQELTKQRKKLAEIISAKTNMSVSQVYDLFEKETYIASNEAIEMSLATDIISNKKEVI